MLIHILLTVICIRLISVLHMHSLRLHPTISCITIYDKCIHIGYIQVFCNSYICMPQGSSESNPAKQVHALTIIVSYQYRGYM